MRTQRIFGLILPVLIALAIAPLPCAAAEQPVDFNRDVRPIFASKCLQCHGQDERARKAKLRLDVRDVATKPAKSGKAAIVPSHPEQSELVRRISTDDDDDVMPPPKNSDRLSAQQIKTLRTWIANGAPYALHWAYVKPVRPDPPAVKDASWPANEIDRFVLARLEKEGLHPGPAADRYTLIRRLSLDLTGLPPTIAEVDAFVNDASPDAYEKLVDRLLTKPAYGERWARVWLDLARYADSQGYANDPDRTIWRWRDWLIQALNRNEPFDRFTIDIIGGDLEKNASQAQLIATGFNRNTLTNTEGGTQPEEFRSAAVVDRVNTTLQVWMASTIGCAQCHSHKYDPFTQREYYQLFAIFNNTEDHNTGDDAPTIVVPRVGMEKQATDLQPRVEAARHKFEEAQKQADSGQREWEKAVEQETVPLDVTAILNKPAKDRKKEEKDKLASYYRSLAFPQFKSIEADYRKLESQYAALTVTTPVMKEGKPRETHVHIRGNYLANGDKVEPGLPAVFPPPPQGSPMNRLTLAKWIVSPDNPLTARVAVNRLWEELFGIGIVETSEDFGTQGEPPSHPELLDWLATEYVRLGWDSKAMLKRIVTSATYRQCSVVSPELEHRDPLNRLLARGPRVRLSAEEIRDQALFDAGLLSQKMFGPPCQPPKPNFGLSAAFGATTDWKADTNEDRWRRGIYIRVRRNAPYPSMVTFDAPERTYCTLRRIRTNTPLQALVTLNDPCFVEAAQGLARRVLKEGGNSVNSRLTFAFRTCLARPPESPELERLRRLYEQSRAQYEHDPKSAEAMATKPLGAAPPGADVRDLAAWTVVSNVLLNLDETIDKR